jgi:hypothetical protein
VTRNIEMLIQVARGLGDLRPEVVFVGGAVVELFVTDPAAPRPRFTDDVDVVVEITTRAEWYRLGERLRSRGFREDRREGAPICRWMLGNLTVDVMPEMESILGFTNRWYAMAQEESDERELPGRVLVRIIRAPLFLATKVEAFGSRGGGDYAASQDIEDVVAVIDGRRTLITETSASPPELRRFLVETAEGWLANARFLEALPGHLPGDSASQLRVPIVLGRLREIADL